MKARVSSSALLEALTMASTAPGGANHQIQFNDNGTFGGITGTSNDAGGGEVGIPAVRANSLNFGDLIFLSAVISATQNVVLVGQPGFPFAIAPIVCQPWTRDVGAGTTLGTVTGWVKAYDMYGTYLGKCPVYDDIT